MLFTKYSYKTYWFIVVTIISFFYFDNMILAAEEFETNLHIEQNLTDDDGEIVLEIIGGGEEGFGTILVLDPSYKPIINTTFSNGMREILLESPEITDQQAMFKEYPEGDYLIYAISPSGAMYANTNCISHDMPAGTQFLSPTPKADNVSLTTTISWLPVENAESYIIEVKNDELDLNFTTKVLAKVTSIGIPFGFLQANTEYELGICTKSKINGNVSCVETTFETVIE